MKKKNTCTSEQQPSNVAAKLCVEPESDDDFGISTANNLIGIVFALISSCWKYLSMFLSLFSHYLEGVN